MKPAATIYLKAKRRFLDGRARYKSTLEALRAMGQKHEKLVECVTLGVTFDSVSEAASHLGISISGVSAVCRGIRNKVHGLKFQFV